MKITKTITVKVTIDTEYFNKEENIDDFMNEVIADTKADVGSMYGVEVTNIEYSEENK